MASIVHTRPFWGRPFELLDKRPNEPVHEQWARCAAQHAWPAVALWWLLLLCILVSNWNCITMQCNGNSSGLKCRPTTKKENENGLTQTVWPTDRPDKSDRPSVEKTKNAKARLTSKTVRTVCITKQSARPTSRWKQACLMSNLTKKTHWGFLLILDRPDKSDRPSVEKTKNLSASQEDHKACSSLRWSFDLGLH